MGQRGLKKPFLPAKMTSTQGYMKEEGFLSQCNSPVPIPCIAALLLSPGLGAVEEGGDELAPPVLVEDQRLATGQDAAAKADLGSTDRVKIVVGGEAGAGEALRDEHGEGLRCRLTCGP